MILFNKYIIPPPADFPAKIKIFSGKSANNYSNMFTAIRLLKIIPLHSSSIYGIIIMYDVIDSAVHQRNTSMFFTIFLVFFHILPKGEGV